MDDKPSVGRFVHYVSDDTFNEKYQRTCRIAVVTEVGGDSEDQDTVGLCVFDPTGVFFRPLGTGGSRRDEELQSSGSWHRPERVHYT